MDRDVPAYRVCSMLPSATEIMGLLEVSDRLVGVSAECDWPPAVRNRPVVSASRVETAALEPGAIDRAVGAAVAEGRSLYEVRTETVRQLRPDLLLTQDLCTVCAVSSGQLQELAVPTLAVDAHTLQEIAESVRTLAQRLGVLERGHQVMSWMWQRLAECHQQARGRPRPRVLVCEWPDPPFVGGHWVPEMLRIAGAEPVLGTAGEPSFATTWQRIRQARPDLVVLAPCGCDVTSAARMPLPDVGCRVVAVDANAYFSRPSPRVVDGVAQLAFLAHPDTVPDPGLPAVDMPPAD